MRKSFLLSIVGIAIFLGCATAQKEVVQEVKRPSRQEVCQNCMAQFKASLGEEKFTREVLYQQCPVCKPTR